MEKFHLPVLSENPFIQPEKKEKELPVEFKIAKAFLYQKYPLSEAGEKLRKEVEGIVKTLKSDPTNHDALEKLKEISDELPTVESPHLELFADLDVSPEDEKEIFGLDLKVVQVTKGCRHQCEHCAAGADKKVQVMPFAAVLQIAEKAKLHLQVLEQLEAPTKQAFTDFVSQPEIKSLIEEINSMFQSLALEYRGTDFARTFPGKWSNTWSDLSQLSAWIDSAVQKQPEKFEILIGKSKRLLSLFAGLPLVKRAMEASNTEDLGELSHVLSRSLKVVLLNYYDSDPFDYRDTTFLHNDGTPADYGDVVEALRADHRLIEFTTAGWPKDDAIAQRAAEKIARLPKDALVNPRISLHPYETGTSKNNPAAYYKDMENVLETLAPIKPTVIYFDKVFKPEHEAYLPVLEDLYFSAYTKWWLPVHGNPGNSVPVSRYSGRAAEEFGQIEKDRDVMSCMPGIHVYPDGSVAWQDEEGILNGGGTRPQSLDKRIFTLKK